MTGFEDIIFENRNKEYGSYDLRKKYPRYMMWGFLLSFAFLFVSVGIVFIVSNSEEFFAPKMPKQMTVESLQLLNIEDLYMPEPPAAKQKEERTDLSDPEIKDTVIHQTQKQEVAKIVEHASQDSISDKGNGTASDGVSNGDSLLYLRVDEMPEFAGGQEGIGKFFRDNISQNVKNSKAKMKVVVQFSITKSGEVKDISVVLGADPMIDKEIVRVLSMMPRWKPGKQGGRPIDVRFRMPINI